MSSYFFRVSNSYNETSGEGEWLHINNFGYHRDITSELKTYRPRGRKDYQLLYVVKGEIIFGKEKISDGDFFIYSPGDAQSYSYKETTGNLYFWIHFTGHSVENILKGFGIKNGKNCGNGRKNEVEKLFRMLLDELKTCSSNATKYATALLYSLISLLSEEAKREYHFTRAIAMLENLKDNTGVESLAEIYGITPEHFIRAFKKFYGTTPLEYRITFRLSYAKNLLIDTDFSVSEIARQCGFSDQFYFSRLFKKHNGVSPQRYRSTLFEN